MSPPRLSPGRALSKGRRPRARRRGASWTPEGGATISEGGSRNGGTFEIRDIDTAVGARLAGSGTGWHMHGDVRLYERALSAADMAALAAEG